MRRAVPSDLKPAALDDFFHDMLSELKSHWQHADQDRKEAIADFLLESIENFDEDDFWGTEGFFRD